MATLRSVTLLGTRAGQPAANAVADAALYYVTDEGVLEQSNGATWDAYSGATSDLDFGEAGDITTIAMGDTAAAGATAEVADAGHTHGMVDFATPAIVHGTAAAAGAAVTPIRSDATLLTFDATVPVTQAFADAAAAGAATVAARRDHTHGMMSDPVTAHTALPAAHHAKYLDSEAIAAVEGEATLDLTGAVTMASDLVISAASTSVDVKVNSTSSVQDDLLGRFLVQGNGFDVGQIAVFARTNTPATGDSPGDMHLMVSPDGTSAPVTAITILSTGIVDFANVPTMDGVAFPATQVPSADANTMDDYEENDWTPDVGFATPGDESVAYTTQIGRYQKVGKFVHVIGQVLTSTFTHTTASGNFEIGGLPFAIENTGSIVTRVAGSFSGSGWTDANAQSLAVVGVSGTSLMWVQSAQSAGAKNVFGITEFPTAAVVDIEFELWYEAED